MKKVLDFCHKHKKGCITFSAVLVAIIVIVVVVVLRIPSGEGGTAKPNATSQPAKISASPDQDNGSASTASTTNTSVTKTAGTGEENTDSSTSSVNTGSNTTGGSANANGSGLFGSSSSSPAPSSTSSNTPESTSSSNSSGGISHRHIWKDHVTSFTVVDVPAQSVQVTEYHMYYWDSQTWQTSEDPAVFKAWERQKMEWIRTYHYENNMPPELFKGYDQNGHPQYTNDHSIVTYYKNTPAVTHEEQRVDYQYCTICGITR